MTCKLCNSGNTRSFDSSHAPHTYCHTCGGHDYAGQLFDRKTWDAWVNGERPAREGQFDFPGDGA